MFKELKDKRYWILLLPFLMIGILLLIYLPQNLKPFSILLGLLFWIVYYIWIHLSINKDVRGRNE
ncbi:sterol desaturase/sphingolipid hydroxylase (fatty acid hydroxylase superfamily) [Metabacillus crassostreae]|nr:sterol desaturase/sphingolipid hydroxylase (fatty acid hydroxylase superfamily) [Metabacillus crassostreae]